jgi:YbbR domain-containing protein
LVTSNNTLQKKSKPGKTTAFFICIAVATFLWLVKSLNTTYTYTVKIPVEFKNLPQNKKPLYGIPEYLNVDVKASGLKLFFILLNQPFKKITVDFNNLKPLSRNYILTPLTVDFKSSLKFETAIKRISPDTLYFIENSGYQKNVPVKVVCSLKAARGYGYKSPVIHPDFLTITGDSSSVKNIDTIYTQTFILNNLSETVERNLPLLKPSDNVYINVNYVNMKIEVEKLIEQTIFLPLSIINQPLNAKSTHVFPSRVKVRFTSLQNDFNQADTSNFKATVNCSNINAGKAQVFLSTQPGNVHILSVEPKETEILIIKK